MAKKGVVDLNSNKNLIIALIDAYVSGETLGSYGDEKVRELASRLKYEDYCVARGIDYSEMTDSDFEDWYLNKMEEEERACAYGYNY